MVCNIGPRRRPSWARSLFRSGPRFLVCLSLLLAAPARGEAQTQPRESEAVARFDGYAGEHFSVDSQEPAQGGILVKTRLIQASEPAVELDYLTHDMGQRPQIIDVFLAGTISELATRRSEFSSVLRQTGYDGLIAALRQKANG